MWVNDYYRSDRPRWNLEGEAVAIADRVVLMVTEHPVRKHHEMVSLGVVFMVAVYAHIR